MVTMNHTKEGVAEKLISDCKEAVDFIRNSPPSDSDRKSEVNFKKNECFKIKIFYLSKFMKKRLIEK